MSLFHHKIDETARDDNGVGDFFAVEMGGHPGLGGGEVNDVGLGSVAGTAI